MPVPEFVLALRSKIGHDPLPLPGVTAVVLDDQERVLLVRRADNGLWTLVTGCLDPGEQPAVGAVREILEETGVEAAVERLVNVEALELSSCPNGDQVYWLNLTFRCQAVRGEARVNDDESTAVGWFQLDSLPTLPERQMRYVDQALHAGSEAWFVRPASPVA